MRAALLVLAFGATGFANNTWQGMATGIAIAAFTELTIRLCFWARDVGIF